MRITRTEVILEIPEHPFPVKAAYGPEVFPRLLKIGIAEGQPWVISIEGPRVKKNGSPSASGGRGNWMGFQPETWPAWVKNEVEKLQDMISAANEEQS